MAAATGKQNCTETDIGNSMNCIQLQRLAKRHYVTLRSSPLEFLKEYPSLSFIRDATNCISVIMWLPVNTTWRGLWLRVEKASRYGR